MPKVRIVGWRAGLQKIPMNSVLREHLPLGLKDAKRYVDDTLNGKTSTFTFADAESADALAKALDELGAMVEVEHDAL
jgi:ribosomal protein L7/L12